MATPRTGSKRRTIVLAVVVVIAILAAALILYQYQQSNSAKGVTVTVDGSAYYSTTVPVTYNMSTLTFKGVRFDFAYIFTETPAVGPYKNWRNVTSVTAPCPPGAMGGASLCSEGLPQVQVTFPDGSVEYFNRATAVSSTVTYQRPSSYPWFSTHRNPEVAIMLNTNAPTASLTLYVST